MDLLLNKYKYSQQQQMQHYNNKRNAAVQTSPLLNPSKANSNPSFTGSFSNRFSQLNIKEIIEKIDNVLGDNFFSKTLEKTEIAEKLDDLKLGDFDKLETSILRDAGRTISYPFKNLWLDLGNGIATLFRKMKLDGVADAMQKDGGALSERLKDVEREKSITLSRNILEKYLSSIKTLDGEKRFQEDVASGIAKIAKNYNSRDERTLNRMATSTVSALYSAADFYNISMLQKDDKKEAKKAEKGRFKQEMTRMLISAGTTFATLGILDKYLKRDIRINAAVIALSALLSEVGSRIINKTPLHPLSPEEAAKIAQSKNIANPKQETQNTNTNNVTFKSNNQTKQIFAKFAQKDGSFTALDNITIQNAKEKPTTKTQPKKKMNFVKYLGLASLGCSIFYLAAKAAKGEFSARIARKELFGKHQNEINKFINGETSSIDGIKKQLDKINQKQKKQAKKVDLLSKLKNILTKKNTTINLEELKSNLEKLKETEDGKKIATILDQYIKDIGNEKTLKTRTSISVIEGVYDGVTKVIKTVYQILSIPGALINGFFEKGYFKAGPFSKSEKAFAEMNKKINKRNQGNVEKEFIELNKLFKKHKDDSRKIVEQIQKNTRNFETSAETGELASLSRTLVTAISTYFFVNDYGNKVLIESGGKNVEEANEERKERMMHKVANFIFNGTLMNTFNSICKVPLNNSLTQATIIASATETTNEFLVRKSICQPILKKGSKKAILDYEQKQLQQKGFMGWWSRTFKKITGKKTLSQKAGISNTTNSSNSNEDKKLTK